MDLYAANASQLSSALAHAHDGDTIKLAGGDYTAIYIKGLKFASGVTITSADASHPAVLSTININTSSGITLTGVEVGVKPYTTGVTVGSSSNITLSNLKVHGTTTADAGNGFMIRGNNGVTVSNIEVHHVNEGINQFDNTHLTIEDSNFHNIGADGIRGGGSSWVSIKDNYFTDFDRVSAEHPDAIQFWTTNEKTSAHDIDIENNVIVRGAGTTAQGIFITDQTHYLPYSNVTVANNAVVGMLYNGIMVEHTNGANISGNLVAGYPGVQSWIRVENDSNVHVTDNAATYKYITNGSGIVASGNTTVSSLDPSNPTTLNSWLSSHGLSVEGGVVTTVAPAAPTAPTAPSAPSAPSAPAAPAAPAALTTPDAGGTLHGTAAADTIVGGNGTNFLYGAGGNDVMKGGTGVNIISGDAGNDTLVSQSNNGDMLSGGDGNDSLSSTGLHAVLNGNAGNDTIHGGGAGEMLYGGQGADSIVAGGGGEWLSGDAGNDTLVGGSGADVFHFGAGGNVDHVIGFDAAHGDHVQLAHGSVYSLHQVGADTVIDLGHGDEMILQGVNLSSLPSGWLFVS